MNAATRRFIRQQAGSRCEYCQIAQAQMPALVFHVEHIVARQHGGPDDPENLCLACAHCNRHKGPNIAGVDPETGEVVPLYHPRRDVWDEHFEWDDAVLAGKTREGRATIAVLKINLAERIQVRQSLVDDPSLPSE